MLSTKEKKTAADVIIERFLKDVEERESMPWQRPYERHQAFNYFTMKPYRGINRLLLPFGEYITRRQINEYNEQHGEDFRFQKGIKWYPVVFFTRQEKEVTREEMLKAFPDCDLVSDGYVGNDSIWTYAIKNSKLLKTRNVLKYFEVADRKWFANSKGETLPSRLASGEVTLTKLEPKKIVDDYIEREGIRVIHGADCPCYHPSTDILEFNNYMSSEDAWFSTAFHEIAHSTGHVSRLNRGFGSSTDEDKYAEEECIAEIASCLLCAECGITDFETNCTREYDNNLAYVQSWKKRVSEWGKKFIYIVSEAEKAYEYILENNHL